MKNNNPFETIAYWLRNQELSSAEKDHVRETLRSYMTTHPVKSGLISRYTFRSLTVALASLVLVLGTSVGITQASLSALPNQNLYGVKIWIEEFKASNQKTPEARIAFESERINTRFNEARTLAVRHKLDETTSQVIQSGLEHSRESIHQVTDALQEANPELALRTTNNLETTFSSNAKILASIEKNTNQNIGTIVLAAQKTTDRLALEKVKFERIIALQPNESTKESTEQKLDTVIAKLKSTTFVTEDRTPSTLATLSSTTTGATSTEEAPEPTDNTASASSSVSASTSASTTPIAPVTPNKLLEQAQQKINVGAYSEALITLQKAEQVIDETNLTQSLEKTYNIKTTTAQ